MVINRWRKLSFSPIQLKIHDPSHTDAINVQIRNHAMLSGDPMRVNRSSKCWLSYLENSRKVSLSSQFYIYF